MPGVRHPRSDGFTLVEMAVVLVVMGFVMLSALPLLTALRSNSQRSATQSNLQALMLATAAFAQANGCLPCPTPAGTTGVGFGRVRGDAGVTPASCGGCSTPQGIPPYMSLGLPPSAAHDGFGHWITMRVDPALTAASLGAVVPPTKPAACTCSAPVGTTCTPTPSNCTCMPAVNGACTPLFAGLSQQGLCAPSGTGAGQLSRANSISVQTSNGGAQSAAVIFVSYGAHGYGSYVADARFFISGINGQQLPFPSSYPSCTANTGYARCNAAGTTLFYNAPTVLDGDPYDDILVFADRNALVSMFGNGSCQTAW